jgi:alcohol dehydrogenase (NADP+)
MTQSTGYAALSAGAPLQLFEFNRRMPTPNDIILDIDYCGICHSDIHASDNDAGMTPFPVVPGHEVIGHVKWVGSAVTRFKVGEIAAVGCYTDSCRTCSDCLDHREHMCEHGFIGTFAGYERDGVQPTYGGFSNNYVCDENYVYRVPTNLNPAGAAPLLCAGLTTWTPLRRWNIGPGKRVGIVGLGGLGHMAVKLATALGADVVVFTASARKTVDAAALGAKRVVVTSNAEQMQAAMNTCHFIMDTVSAPHEIDGYLSALRADGTLCLLGIAPGALQFNSLPVVYRQKCIAGSFIGGVRDAQDVLDFAGKHNITADIELLPAHRINDAYQRLRNNDVKYRFVLDMKKMIP